MYRRRDFGRKLSQVAYTTNKVQVLAPPQLVRHPP